MSNVLDPLRPGRRSLLAKAAGWIDRVVTRATALVDPPLAADAKPLEVQGAIVDEIERRVEPIGGGRRALPHRHVVVTVLASDEEARTALDAALAPLQAVTLARLQEIRCDVPTGFTLSLRYVSGVLDDWAPGQRFAIQPGDVDLEAAAHGAATRPALRLTVVRGRTVEPAYTLNEPHVRIGRSAAPVDSNGHVRQNQVVFIEGETDEHTGSVGRAHASIHYDAARGSYQLFDDGSRNGTRVVRGGTTYDVIRRDPVGVTLRSGDEIQLGTAAIRIEIQRT